jgi:ankyrin repeat protein
MNIRFLTLFVFLTLSLFANSENDFFRACLNGELDTMLALYNKDGMRLTYAKDKDKNTPLHLACCSKKGGSKADIIAFLIEKGANVNAYNNYESTPLTIAVSNGNYEGVKLLLQAPGIRVNQGYQQNFTPLHLAVITQVEPLIRLILSHPDTNPNFGTRDGATPLHYAAMQGLVDEARILIDDPRTNINAPQHDADYSGATPLHFAAMQAKTEIVSMLLEKSEIQVNATVNQGPHRGFTPLHFAVLNPDTVNVLSVVKQLLENGADPKQQCEAGKTPGDLTSVAIIKDALKTYKKKRK